MFPLKELSSSKKKKKSCPVTPVIPKFTRDRVVYIQGLKEFTAKTQIGTV